MSGDLVKVGDRIIWPGGWSMLIVHREDMYEGRGALLAHVGVKMVLFRERDGKEFDLTIYDS